MGEIGVLGSVVHLLILSISPLGILQNVSILSHPLSFSSHEPCTQYLHNIFPGLWLTGCSHINNAPFSLESRNKRWEAVKKPLLFNQFAKFNNDLLKTKYE